MRYLALILIPVVALLAAPASSGEPGSQKATGGSLDELLDALFTPNVQRSLRSGSIIAGNLISGDKWYVIDASEISAAREILKHKKPFSANREYVPKYPVPPYVVVLWGVSDGKVVPLKGFRVSPSLGIYIPLDPKAPDPYIVPAGKARDCLRKLLKRVEAGQQQPVPVEWKQDDKKELEPTKQKELRDSGPGLR
jgi:hypothetical protein